MVLPTKKPRHVIRVMLVDDHDLMRGGLKRILKDVPEIDVVAEARTGEEAIKIAREKLPHVILMDIKMPVLDGFQTVLRLKLNRERDQRYLNVLIVTGCNNDLYPSKLLKAGASGYLTKDASPEEMLHAIRTIYAGRRYISPPIANKLAFKHADEKGSPFDALSERELQVMLMITMGVKVQEIAEKLCLSPKTVNSYRYRIFDKLGVENDVELTLMAIKRGLVDTESTKQTPMFDSESGSGASADDDIGDDT